jgi:Ca2+-binding RTX toxin-like protein
VRVVAVLVLAAGLLVAVPHAADAQASCNGVPATVVGSPGGSVGGTDERDVVVTNGAGSIDTYGGIDVVCVTGDLPFRIDGGANRDRIVVSLPGAQVRLDLGGSLMVGESTATVEGFEDATVRASNLFLDGTSGRNNLRWNMCTGTITGGRGADRATWAGGADLCDRPGERQTAAYGGDGRDVLVGSPWDDVLVGGRGEDRADGRHGFDRCRVENPHRCESDR